MRLWKLIKGRTPHLVDEIGLVMGLNDTAIYFQTTLEQITLDGRNTGMYLNDATFRQRYFRLPGGTS